MMLLALSSRIFGETLHSELMLATLLVLSGVFVVVYLGQSAAPRKLERVESNAETING